MADVQVKGFAKVDVISSLGANLANNARAAGDYDNSTNKALECDVFVEAQYVSSAPAVGDIIGNLYVMFGDGESTENFPEGGDGTTGTDDDPQGIHFVAGFESVNPSTSALERLSIQNVPINGKKTIRLVFKNVSGVAIDNVNFKVSLVPKTFSSV